MSDLDELRYHTAQAARYARLGVTLGVMSFTMAVITLFVLLVAL